MKNTEPEKIDKSRRKMWVVPTLMVLGDLNRPAVAGGSDIGDPCNRPPCTTPNPPPQCNGCGF